MSEHCTVLPVMCSTE